MITLISVETTPNPNSMKLNLSKGLEVTGTFSTQNQAAAPELAQQLLCIDGVASVFIAASFITLNRDPRKDWPTLLNMARSILISDAQDQAPETEVPPQSTEPQGQVQVWVQTFRGVPVQVKVTDGFAEERAGLPTRFGETARELQTHFGADYLKERHWADWGARYGGLTGVAQEVAEEIESLLDEASLERRKQEALGNSLEQPKASISNSPEASQADKTLDLNDADWQRRFHVVQRLEASEVDLPLLIQALQDEKPPIRRWAAAKLAGLKTLESVEALCDTLRNDTHVGVRRTAGDSLSDIGDVAAQNAVCQALSDQNKLVRWRAARFLAEVGNEAALPALKKALNDPEYEVRLEIEAAIDHIEAGSKAALPVWKQMSQDL